MLNVSLGKTYTFNTKAPGLLGATIRNAKLIGVVDYNTALTYDNIDLKFRTIYPVLPAGTPDDPRSCAYYHFQSESGEKIVLAEVWIEELTLEVVEHINFAVTVTDASLQDMTRVRDALLALGFTRFNIKQV